MRTTVYLQLHLPPPAYFSEGEEVRPGWVPYDPDAKYAPASKRPRTIAKRVTTAYLARIARGEIKLKPSEKAGFRTLARQRIIDTIQKLRRDTGTIYTSKIYRNQLNRGVSVNSPELTDRILAANSPKPKTTVPMGQSNWTDPSKFVPARPTLKSPIVPLLGVAALGGAIGYAVTRSNHD